MKVFAIVTACLMAAGGATYYLSSSDTCPLTGCPVAKTGGCCATDSVAKSDCCAVPCPACATDCRECCTVCEACCVAGASVPTVKTVKADCCAAGDVCCAPGAACCADKTSPASLATSAAVAGVTLK
jgi:hypothetical protein